MVDVSKVRQHLYVIMTFFLPLSASLSKLFCLDIMDNAILDKITVLDTDSDKSSSFLNISTYRSNKIEFILDYLDADVVVKSAWPKIEKKVAEIKVA